MSDEIVLRDVFPELKAYSANPLDKNQFAALPYFEKYYPYINEKQTRIKAEKSRSAFQLIKVSKGTVIYSHQDIADQGYILLEGCVELLNRKNNREKTQTFPGHTALTVADKVAFLTDKFSIPKDKVQSLCSIFYQDKFSFKFVPFRTIFTRQQFGFGEMVRNSSRVQTAIATDESLLLTIDKNDFDTLLRDFQVRKQGFLVSQILNSTAKKQSIQEIYHKMIQIMNSPALLQFDSDDIVYKQGDYASGIYYVLQGELELRKSEVMEVPKKYLKSENTGPLRKQVVIKVTKIGSNSLVGEQQIFSGKKTRNFTVISSLNDTLIVKIDQNLFLKAVSEFINYEKDLISNAVYKKTIAEESFTRQVKKIRSSFMNQYEQYDSKRKQRMLSNFLGDADDKNQMFQVYAPEGVFFRDTFQKLQGFDQSQKDPNKKQGIKRLKLKNNALDKQRANIHINNPSMGKSPNLDKSRSFQKFDPTQKLLFSPKKTVHAVDFFTEPNQNKSMARSKFNKDDSQPFESSPVKLEKQGYQSAKVSRGSSPSLVKQYRSIGKFQQIQKDEAVYKRVLIKNGLYPKQRKIDRANTVKPLIHHNFDEIVKQCISRKNQALKRVSKEKQEEVILDSYRKTLTGLQSNLRTSSQILKFSNYTSPCRGTDEMKKRMQSLNHLHSGRATDLDRFKKQIFTSTQMQECIGVNKKPKSSDLSRNSHGQRVSSMHKPPQKIVLLNHMMKPITYYNSTQL